MRPEEYQFDLGRYSRGITTKSTASQTWFNRGLVWSYAFAHDQAAFCFKEAVSADDTCAMAFWGLAYCIGPNYNKQWSFFDDSELREVVQRGHDSVQQALAKSSHVSPVEQELIKAIQRRYPKPEPADAGTCEVWNRDFAKAMELVHDKFPGDLDVITIYVDAVMNLNPWNMWDLASGKPTEGARTLEMLALLQHALTLDGALEHPGLLHLYIHLIEMSPDPESGLVFADHLRGLVPDAGHLNHMPTHLDVLCGRYQEAIQWNSKAIAADEKYVAVVGAVDFYALYRAHNYHFRVYAAMFSGNFAVALETAASLEKALPDDLLRVKSPPMADWLEGFLSIRAHVLVRFGRWEEILDLPVPEDVELRCMTVAIVHYAKGVALSALGRIEEAEVERQLFRNAQARVPSSRTLFNNTCVDILQVAAAMLDGELAYRAGDVEEAFAHLRRATALEDGLPYDEPWGWMQPTRHAYGALSLEQGRVEEALEAYRADLGLSGTMSRALRHPGNVWALHGAYECLVKLGRGEEAEELRPGLERAMAGADVEIKASCYCRRGVVDDS
jgi:tetratricopeptide (TPR) repeat protein